MICVSIGSIEVDWNCHPETLLWVTEFNDGPLGVIGENLKVKWPMWAPLIEIVLNRIWNKVNGSFSKFIEALIRIWLHEYLHIELRCEATKPPSGRGTLPLEYKGKNEELYVYRMVEAIQGPFYFLDDDVS